jgi:hypothetical protein
MGDGLVGCSCGNGNGQNGEAIVYVWMDMEQISQCVWLPQLIFPLWELKSRHKSALGGILTLYKRNPAKESFNRCQITTKKTAKPSSLEAMVDN